MKLNRILRDAGAAGGGGAGDAGGTPPPNDFVKGLPQEFQADPVFKNVDSLPTLLKNYKHAQSMIGAKRVGVPDANWDDAKYNEMYDTLGRPKTPADYKVPEFQFEEGLTLDPKKMETAKAALYSAGLTQRQVDQVLKFHFQDTNETYKGAKAGQQAAKEAVTQQLKQEWGSNYDANVNLAKSVIGKFGDDTIRQAIEAGAGNDPALIKLLSKVGAAMLEDKQRGGNGADGMEITEATKATSEIQRLKTDSQFLEAFNKQHHPGHKAAVDRWTALHRLAYPGVQQG
jgi:hypothetical protein